MIYNDIFKYNHIIGMIDDAQKAIEENDMSTIERILTHHKLLGIENPNNFDIRPFYNIAISNERDDIAYLLFKSFPSQLKLHSVEHSINEKYSLYTDILGISVVYNRVALINRLLEEKYPNAFNIDGIRRTNSFKQNFYHIMEHDSEKDTFTFSVGSKTYISSPLLISIIMGHWESYSLLKSKGAYFDSDDESCRFHLERCTNERIIDDVKRSFVK